MHTDNYVILSPQQLKDKFSDEIKQDRTERAAEAASIKTEVLALIQRYINCSRSSISNMTASDAIAMARGKFAHRLNVDEQTQREYSRFTHQRDAILLAVNSVLNVYGWRFSFEEEPAVSYTGRACIHETPVLRAIYNTESANA